MPSNPSQESLTGLFDRVEENTDGDAVTVDELLHALGRRSFGPLFILVSLLAILPTGAIPGMSVLTGLVMLILSAQLLFGSDRIWLPGFVTRRSIGRERLVNSLDKARGPAERFSRILKPRLDFFFNPPFLQVVAAGCLLLSLTMFPLAVLPFGAFPASLSLIAIGAGLTVRDGLLIAAGVVMMLIGLGLTVYLWPF